MVHSKLSQGNIPYLRFAFYHRKFTSFLFLFQNANLRYGMPVWEGNAIFYFASLRGAGSMFTVHHESLIFDESGCTKPCRAKYNNSCLDCFRLRFRNDGATKENSGWPERCFPLPVPFRFYRPEEDTNPVFPCSHQYRLLNFS